MDIDERRVQERRQDEQTAAQITEAAALQRAFGSDAAQRFLKLRGIGDQLAQDLLLENYDRRQQARRERLAAAS
ncbi:hypothetical protein KY495_03065 [Massilia sp. PAMC28688]|uniref:hypothetical protein n=1 Tax=Massilia sp. PAMC28688 TaxID=2861283 RepID=UPI001C62BAB3|nr:hypothetical protein [Massilia sp. PAMC28688]QYF94221.1 hypothetical protein KY495_03065 [Massilia sp. PAMC28688]